MEEAEKLWTDSHRAGHSRAMPEDRHHKPSPGSAARHWRSTEIPKEGDKGLAAKSRHPRGRDIRMREMVRNEEQSCTIRAGCTLYDGSSRNEVVTPSAMRRAWYGLGRQLLSGHDLRQGVGRLFVL